MSWRQVTAIVWLGFALGALTDTALRWRAEKSTVVAAFSRAGIDEAVRPSSDPDVGATVRRPSVSERPPASNDARATATTGISAEGAIDVLRHRDLDIPVE